MIIHIMIDLETLGNIPYNGVIIAIGAQAFTMDEELVYPNEREFEVCTNISHRFFYPIDFDSQLKEYGFIIEGDTLAWWLQADKFQQFVKFVNSKYKVTLREAFEKFAWWAASLYDNQKQLMLWSHGVTYDCMHLEQKWPIVLKESFNRVCPFRQMRDTRTIFAAYEESFSKSAYPAVTRKRHHHPLEDAWMQAIAVQTAWKGLTRG